MMKVRFDGHSACGVYVYADNGRVTGHCRELCWASGRRFASVSSKVGVHDAARKRTFPSWEPGPYAGTVCHTSGGEIIGTVSQEKWEKTKALVTELADTVAEAVIIHEQEGMSQARQGKRWRMLVGSVIGLICLDSACWRYKGS